MAGSRQGSSKQKTTRSEVRGWRYKKANMHKKELVEPEQEQSEVHYGEVAELLFAATPRDYSKKINKKMYRAALRSIFSELLRQGKLVAIETPVLEKPKTKEIAKFLNDFSLSKVLFIYRCF